MPPNIDDSFTSSDVIAQEGDNVTLRCKANGSPQPALKWKRDDGNRMVINKSLEGKVFCKSQILLVINIFSLFLSVFPYCSTLLLSFCRFILLLFNKVNEVEGELLELERISRLHMGAYLCIASNGVPPSVSKRIKVSVDCKY